MYENNEEFMQYIITVLLIQWSMLLLVTSPMKEKVEVGDVLLVTILLCGCMAYEEKVDHS